MRDLLKDLVLASGISLAEGLAALVEGGTLDDAYAKMIESLSDSRLSRKSYPDGRYIPPSP